MADAQAVLSALEAFSQPSDKVSFDRANAWLQDFQHSNEAWAACNVLLLSPESPPLAKLFAAQTFRSKVTYDLNQLDPSHLPSLRDTLLTALSRFTAGPKAIVVQLCLALSGLALQFPAWQDAVQSVIDRFGRDPGSVPTLLEFLRVLPEEITGNTKIPVSNDDYRSREALLLTANAKTVLSLLSMYIVAPGITTAVQSQIFFCLRSWVNAGEVTASAVAETPLFSFAFEALESESLFDAAVDVICDLIHETQELDDNMPVIKLIVPKLIEIKPKISAAKDDSDQVRGYARIFSEAGEVYRLLLLQHPETFFPIVEAIGECSAYPDLDVVPITFQFWMRLAQSIGKKPSVSPLFLDAYRTLMNVMIQHLHFPEDPAAMNAQEADDFRSFRHVMGDTLKDCCYVLGTESCLSTVYQYLCTALERGNAAGGRGVVSWQEIEAPLFSLRSMGAEIDPKDDRIIPKIMDLVPNLPDHPRVRYAAILVMSRYSEWTSYHPGYITYQLQFISSGFESTDSEVPAAASQALNYLCLDCKQHMIPFLPQLHSFLSSVGSKMIQEDRRRIYEAVAHIMTAMPMDQAAQSLQTFSVDILAKIHAVAASAIASKQDLQEVSDGLENLEAMLSIVQTFGNELPATCSNSCSEAWSVFDPFLSKFGGQYELAERANRVLRHGMKFFGPTAESVIPAVLARMGLSFEATGFASYLWITGKIVSYFGDGENPGIRSGIKDAYERSSTKMVSLLQQKALRDIPDVVEDYLQLVLQMLEMIPDVFFQSSAFPIAVQIAIAAMTLIQSEVIFKSLDIIRGIVTHDCLDPHDSSPPPKFPVYAAAIREVINVEGQQLTSSLLEGLVNDFPEDSASTVITIIRMLAILWPDNLLVWLPAALDQMPTAASFVPAKKQLLVDIASAIKIGQSDKVKHAVIAFHRSSVRTKDRRRVSLTDN